ncbi:hypothetical protein MPSI1_002767 [Malassezia psittaci]|uniref:Uncharacterized protein n=1 Tax=Malassezia psittaci TaxID=1821823 RepID=A0AAF0FBA6_9BASI|nr:hypothetical protein MPSI1_002767 [Malassezia psittaci]
MLHSRGGSPTRTPHTVKRLPVENSSPFKPTPAQDHSLGKGISTAQGKRSAFSDKTNRSPSPSRNAGSPSKSSTSPYKPAKWSSTSNRTPFVRTNSFVTPAANIGRAGQVKARMADWQDTLSIEQQDVAPPEVQPAISEEEQYPEIESMPLAPEAPYEFPTELEGLPRASEIGQRLAKPTRPSMQVPVPHLDYIQVPELPAIRRSNTQKKPLSTQRNTFKPKRKQQDTLAQQAQTYIVNKNSIDGFVL